MSHLFLSLYPYRLLFLLIYFSLWLFSSYSSSAAPHLFCPRHFHAHTSQLTDTFKDYFKGCTDQTPSAWALPQLSRLQPL